MLRRWLWLLRFLMTLKVFSFFSADEEEGDQLSSQFSLLDDSGGLQPLHWCNHVYYPVAVMEKHTCDLRILASLETN
jgi:hypothetical protein